MNLKKEITEILEEHCYEICYWQYDEMHIDRKEIDKAVELIMEVINDNPLMEHLK